MNKNIQIFDTVHYALISMHYGLNLVQGWPPSVLESHSSGEFNSNPNQTRLNKFIKV